MKYLVAVGVVATLAAVLCIAIAGDRIRLWPDAAILGGFLALVSLLILTTLRRRGRDPYSRPPQRD